MYEEHSNADLNCCGNQKTQTFKLRNDHANPAPKRSKQKKHWKIESKKSKVPEIATEVDEVKSLSEITDYLDEFQPINKI